MYLVIHTALCQKVYGGRCGRSDSKCRPITWLLANWHHPRALAARSMSILQSPAHVRKSLHLPSLQPTQESLHTPRKTTPILSLLQRISTSGSSAVEGATADRSCRRDVRGLAGAASAATLAKFRHVSEQQQCQRNGKLCSESLRQPPKRIKVRRGAGELAPFWRRLRTRIVWIAIVVSAWLARGQSMRHVPTTLQDTSGP